MNREKLKRLFHRIVPENRREGIKAKYVRVTGWINRLFCTLFDKDQFLYCQADGISYIGTSKDGGVFRNMLSSKCNWAKEEMDIYYNLVEKFYGNKKKLNSGYFLDIGANIGSTFIYFKLKKTSNIKVLAFEPDSDNYTLAKVNAILNNVDRDVVIEKLGVGEGGGTAVLYKHPENPGGNSIVNSPTSISESINMVSIDDYLESKNIEKDEITYIWIDTEGYEPFVLFGAKDLISSTDIPLFMEFNPQVYKQFDGVFERMVQMLEKSYKKYIMVREVENGNYCEHRIEELYSMKGMDKQQGDIVFLN